MNFFYKPKIGIIGLGFVGNAVRHAMEDQCELICVDNDASKTTHKFSDLANCEGIFICVPSPQDSNGRCDTSILESVLAQLSDYSGVIISKCTAPPVVYQQLNKQYKNLVHAPEFLTAKNAVQDYANGQFSIIGGSVMAYMRDAERIIKIGQSSIKSTKFCTIGEASLAKYTINSFLATKVTFMNELYQLATKLGLDYNVIENAISLDYRIGPSHMRVPGPDGQFGFGGACFPKDTSALLKFAEEQDVQLNVLDAAVKKNLLVRLTGE